MAMYFFLYKRIRFLRIYIIFTNIGHRSGLPESEISIILLKGNGAFQFSVHEGWLESGLAGNNNRKD